MRILPGKYRDTVVAEVAAPSVTSYDEPQLVYGASGYLADRKCDVRRVLPCAGVDRSTRLRLRGSGE